MVKAVVGANWGEKPIIISRKENINDLTRLFK